MKIRVTIDGELFEVEIGDLNARPVLANVGGEVFEVWPEEAARPVQPEPAAASLPRGKVSPSPAVPPPSTSSGQGNKTRSILAPIPGVILSVSVKAGDEIAFGQEICILEAMKMKNIIRANRAGKIEVVCVETGAQVHHGQTLIEFAD